MCTRRRAIGGYYMESATNATASNAQRRAPSFRQRLPPMRVPATSTPKSNASNGRKSPVRRVRFALPKAEGGDNYSLNMHSHRARCSCAASSNSRAAVRRYSQPRHGGHSTTTTTTIVAVAASPGVRARVHPTGCYARGTLSPTANAGAAGLVSPAGRLLLKAAADGEDDLLREILERAPIPEVDLNATDKSGRTVLSHLASNGSVDILERVLLLRGVDWNQPDNEGNTALHFAAQAGQADCLHTLLARCKGIDVDARNNMGFTPLMKAALQGRNKCAKMLLLAGANPTLKDNGRGLRADQWARFCGRYMCADVIEKHARQKLLERSTSYGNWGAQSVGHVLPLQTPTPTQIYTQNSGIRSKLKKVFRTSSGPGSSAESTTSSARLVTQLTSAALCASTPVLPSVPSVPPVIKSLIRPLTVPRLQITLVSSGGQSTTSTNYGIEQRR